MSHVITKCYEWTNDKNQPTSLHQAIHKMYMLDSPSIFTCLHLDPSLFLHLCLSNYFLTKTNEQHKNLNAGMIWYCTYYQSKLNRYCLSLCPPPSPQNTSPPTSSFCAAPLHKQKSIIAGPQYKPIGCSPPSTSCLGAAPSLQIKMHIAR